MRLLATLFAAVLATLVFTATAPAYAHGGEFYKPPPPTKKLKRPDEPPPAGTPRSPAAETPPDVSGPETGGSDRKLGPDDWRAWWTTQRAGYAPARPADAETPDSGAAAGLSERDRAVQALRAAVTDADEDVSTAALVALGRIGDRASVTSMIAALSDPRRPRAVREAAACGLAFLGSAKDDDGIARTALEAVALLGENDARLRSIAAYALGLRGDPASGELLCGLAMARRTDRQVACSAAAALGFLATPEALTVLRNLVEKGRDGDDDPVPVRAYAAHALARAGDVASVALLRTAAASPEPGVRRAAAFALGALAGGGDDETQRVLRRLVDQDPEAGVRDAALVALGRQGHPQSKRLLTDALAGGRKVHVTWAATAIALYARKLGDPAIAAPLRAHLAAGTDPALRAAACAGAALARDRDAAPVILRIAEGRNDPWLRSVALAAIPAIVTRDDASSLLRRLLDPAEPPEIRREAASALGVLGDSGAAPALAALTESGERLYVRAAATVALGRIGGPGSSERLRATMETPGREAMLRALSAVGLGLLHARPKIRPLHEVTLDLDWDVMTDASAELMSIL